MRRTLSIILSIMILFPNICEARKKKKEEGIGIVAHRGFWNCTQAGYAKNSIAALRCAQEAGFWGSEFDVSMTADSVLIIYHDNEIEGKRIEDHPYSAFKDIRLPNGEPIPTIDEFLAQGKKYPQTKLVYELKPLSSPEAEERFVNLAIANLAENGLLHPERVMFISFSLNICRKIAGMLPGYTVQFLDSGQSPKQLDSLKINGVDYNHKVYELNPQWIRMARKRKMSINVWTVDKPEDMVRMFTSGVNLLTTDQPLLARGVLQQMGIKEAR